MVKQNILELNGKRYDALTGELVAEKPAPLTATRSAHKGPKFVDGFIKPAKYRPPVVHHAERVQYVKQQPAVTLSAVAAPKVSPVIKAAVKPLKAHQPEHSKTLMRSAVQKPKTSLKRTTKVDSRTDILAKTPTTFITKKLSSRNVDGARLSRAERIAKHGLISRFHHAKPVANAVGQPVAVRRTGTMDVQISKATKAYTLDHLKAAVKPSTAQPKTVVANDVFSRALERATAHEQVHVPLKSRKKRPSVSRFILSGSAIIVTLVALGSFIAYQNQAQLTLRLASAKAGFTASLPNYKPAGFHIGAFQYSPGSVAVSYASKNNGSFQLSQKMSNWDTEALLDNYVMDSAKTYQRVDSAGRTIYLYGHNATWVDNGIWYQVTSDGSLGTNQLVQLATSI